MRTKGIGPQGLGIKGNNGYHIGSPAKFKKHKMHSKSGVTKVAETKEEHLELKSKGYGHKAPSPAKQTTAGEFAYEKSLKDKEMGKSTKVVDKFKAVATALTSDKTYAGEKAKYRKQRKEEYNKKMKK